MAFGFVNFSKAHLLGHGKLLIGTVGAFFVEGPEKEPLTPAGVQARAILAVIALSDRQRVSRRWLESLIWPERAPEQASGSLRQALTAIRRTFGVYADALYADRADVGFAADLVSVDMRDAQPTALKKLRSGKSLLEGMDIRSENFEDWLRQERAAAQALQRHENVDQEASVASALLQPAKKYDPTTLVTHAVGTTGALDAFVANAICAQLARTATDYVNIDVIHLDGAPASMVQAPGSKCVIRAIHHGSTIRILARLTTEPLGKVVWTRELSFPDGDELAGIDAAAALALEVTEAIGECELQASNLERANSMSLTALKDIFSFDPTRLKSADDLLARAHHLEPHAPRPALRALGKAFLALEDAAMDTEQLREDATFLVQDAMRTDPRNALALAFVADVYDLVFKDSNAALTFARGAIQKNPGTGYAYASLGGLELRRKNDKNAMKAADRARRQLSHTSLEVFALMRYCVASMSVGNFEAAMQAAEHAHRLAPNSRPPLRHLYALKLHAKDFEGARHILSILHVMESDFSMRFLREDPSFPAATLRAIGFDKLSDVD